MNQEQDKIKELAKKMLTMDWRKEDKYVIYDQIHGYIEEHDSPSFNIDDLKKAGFHDNEVCEIMQVLNICIDCSMT